jgi:hypothetical protein
MTECFRENNEMPWPTRLPEAASYLELEAELIVACMLKVYSYCHYDRVLGEVSVRLKG